MALATLGVSLGPIFAGLGVIGILVGLAVKDSLKNLAASTLILIHRPYDVDDRVHVVGMGDSAMALVVKPWVCTEHYWPTFWELNRIIKLRLDKEGIEIPFPQRVVTLQSNEGQLDTKTRAASVEGPKNKT